MSHPPSGEPPAGRSPSAPRLSRPAASGTDESGFYRVGGTGRRTSRTTRERGESSPTWTPPRPRRSRLPWRTGKGQAATDEELRFALVYAAGPAGPMRYEGAPVPDVALARAWVRALTDESPGGADGRFDEALHALIASWAAGWVTRVDSEHLDHETDLDRLVGLARHRLAAAEALHDRDRRALAIADSDRDHAGGLLHQFLESAEARVLRRRRRWRGLWRRAMSPFPSRRRRSSAGGGPP